MKWPGTDPVLVLLDNLTNWQSSSLYYQTTWDRSGTGSRRRGLLWSPKKRSPRSQTSKLSLENITIILIGLIITIWYHCQEITRKLPVCILGRLLPTSPCFAFTVALFAQMWLIEWMVDWLIDTRRMICTDHPPRIDLIWNISCGRTWVHYEMRK